MWIATWTIGLALAGSADWQLDADTWRIDEGVQFEQPLSTWSLDDGYLFRVVDDEGAVGAIFVGDGQWTVSFDERRDALSTANRLVMRGGAARQDLVEVAAGADLVLGIDRGVIVGDGVWETLEPTLWGLGRKHRWVSKTADGATEVLVHHDRTPEQARRIAQRVLSGRLEFMRTYAYDPGALMEVERWAPTTSPMRWVDMHTGDGWGRVAGGTTVGGSPGWLSYIRDETGVVDPLVSAQVVAQDAAEGRRVTHTVARRRFPMDADGARGPAQHLDVNEALVRHIFLPKAAAIGIELASVADLQVVARGGTAGVVWVDVPHEEQVRYDPLYVPLPNGWQLNSVEVLGGGDTEFKHLPMTPNQVDGRGDYRTLAVRLDPPLREGETRTVRIRWQDRHRYAHVVINPFDPSGGDIIDMGTATTLLSVLPTVRTNRDFDGEALARVGLPEHLSRNVPVLSGDNQRRWTEGGWRWLESDIRVSNAGMAVGRFDISVDEAVFGLPSVETATRYGMAKDIAPEIRAILRSYAKILPAYPYAQVHMSELMKTTPGLGAAFAGGGMMSVFTTRVFVWGLGPEASFRNSFPQYERMVLASMLHGHYWLDGELRGVDRSLPSSVGPYYGMAFVEAANGQRAAKALRDRVQRCAQPQDGRLGTLYRPRGCTSLAVLDGPLTAWIGQALIFEAIDRTLSGDYPRSWEGLERALEEVSGESMQDFFGQWFYSGLAPKLAVKWHLSDGLVEGTVTSDVPFGRLVVPLAFEGQHGSASPLVTVVDGRASFSVPWPEEQPPHIEIHPRFDGLLHSSTVREVRIGGPTARSPE